MKFGGTSVADTERLKAVAERLVAAREPGNASSPSSRRWATRPTTLRPRARDVAAAEAARARHADLGRRADLVRARGDGDPRSRPRGDLAHRLAGRIVTDTSHGKAKIVDVRARRIHEALDDGRIVLVAGFQGVSTDFEVTTLGRGGSDTTAVALAAALGADVCEIYTDVDGVFTADPRIVPDARKLHAVSYEEMLEMAASGAKVLQLRSVEFARNHGVKLHVRSTFCPAAGTWITEEDERMLEKAMISGVTHTPEETLYRVEGVTARDSSRRSPRRRERRHDRADRRAEIVFSAPIDDAGAVEAALGGLGVSWRARDDLGKVSVIGAGMKSHPGVAAKMFAVLDDEGIEPQTVTTSPIKIACHVARDDVERAVRALHAAFELDRPTRSGRMSRSRAHRRRRRDRRRGRRRARAAPGARVRRRQALRLGALGRPRARRPPGRGGDAGGAGGRRRRRLLLRRRRLGQPRARPPRRPRRRRLPRQVVGAGAWSRTCRSSSPR